MRSDSEYFNSNNVASCLNKELTFFISYNQLRSLLSRTGFGSIKSYWATPEMRFPTQYVSTEASAVREARAIEGFPQGDMRSTRLLMPLVPARWVKHVTPGLAFLAIKQ